MSLDDFLGGNRKWQKLTLTFASCKTNTWPTACERGCLLATAQIPLFLKSYAGCPMHKLWQHICETRIVQLKDEVKSFRRGDDTQRTDGVDRAKHEASIQKSKIDRTRVTHTRRAVYTDVRKCYG